MVCVCVCVCVCVVVRTVVGVLRCVVYRVPRSAMVCVW